MENKTTQEQILNELAGYTGGSDRQYKDYLNCLMTAGFKFLCDRCSCYWLFSDMASVLMCDREIKGEEFILARIKVNDEKEADIFLYRDYNKNDEKFNRENLLYTQHYEYTDFPLNDFEFYICLNELNTYTFMLKEEY